MSTVEIRQHDGTTRYFLADRELNNGDELLLRLHGNRGWDTVTVAGLPGVLRIRCRAADGKELVTTLPEETELRWPRGD